MQDKKERRKNKGFTLIEVLVAAAILSILVPPILSSFVAVARINAKSRRKLSATTIANGVMESVKGFELSRVAKECDYQSDGFYIIAGFTGTAAELNAATLGNVATKSVSKTGGNYNFDGQASGNYAFKFTGVEMDGTKYDVLLIYRKNETSSNATVDVNLQGGGSTQRSTASILEPMAVRVLTYYDVEIRVFRGGDSLTSRPLVSITGTKADYN